MGLTAEDYLQESVSTAFRRSVATALSYNISEDDISIFCVEDVTISERRSLLAVTGSRISYDVEFQVMDPEVGTRLAETIAIDNLRAAISKGNFSQLLQAQEDTNGAFANASSDVTQTTVTQYSETDSGDGDSNLNVTVVAAAIGAVCLVGVGLLFVSASYLSRKKEAKKFSKVVLTWDAQQGQRIDAGVMIDQGEAAATAAPQVFHELDLDPRLESYEVSLDSIDYSPSLHSLHRNNSGGKAVQYLANTGKSFSTVSNNSRQGGSTDPQDIKIRQQRSDRRRMEWKAGSRHMHGTAPDTRDELDMEIGSSSDSHSVRSDRTPYGVTLEHEELQMSYEQDYNWVRADSIPRPTKEG